MARQREQTTARAEAGNTGENAAQLDEGQCESQDLNSNTAEQQEAGNTGENADTSLGESEPKGEEKQGEVLPDSEQGKGDTPPVPPAHGKVTVNSESRKGKTIFAVSGEPIVFDDEGNAIVKEEDALYLKQCPGFVVR